MRFGFWLAVVLILALGAGCAPREAFFKPEGKRAVGRDGFVGAAYRVPPGGNREAEAVAAVSPMKRVQRKSGGEKRDFWQFATVIEFRNKRRGAITFLPESIKLESKDFGKAVPILISRTGKPGKLSGPVEIRHWYRASVIARWHLAAGAEKLTAPLTLHWEYRYGGRSYPQKTVFKVTDSKLAERSLAGDPTGMTTDVDYSSSSGVPFLMNVPFIGALFRSGTTVRSRTARTFGTDIKARGAWWPLEMNVDRARARAQ
jgi:hypothetical protein